MSLPEHPLDRWERREEPIFAALPFGLLGISVALSLVSRDGWGSALGLDLGLAAAAFVWLVAWRPLRLQRAWAQLTFYVGLLVLVAALVVHAPWFGFFAFSGYLYVRFLPRGPWPMAGVGPWPMAGIAVTAVIMATSQAGGAPGTGSSSWLTWGLLVFINVTVAGAVSWFAFVGDQQGERRKVLVADLTATNEQLERALAENAELQARLVGQAREAGVQAERQRMAREIHDTLAQGLTGIVTQLEAAEQVGGPASGGAGWRRHVEAAARLARDSLSEARRSVHAMRPEPLEAARLPEALADVARNWSELHGVPTEVTTTGAAEPMRPEVEVTLLRTAQEALANVAKHADAGRVGLTLSYMGDVVALDVRDDGAGFEPARVAARNGHTGDDGGGFGLEAMRQRVRGLAGTLEIESEPGHGTAVSARVPAIPAGASR